MATIRRGTGIFEQGSLRDKVDQAGVNQPTSARAASGVGASPMEAAMAGSEARKRAVIQDQAQPKERTELGFERLAGSREQATTAEQQARQKADDLKNLGSIQTRVQAKLEQKLNEQAQQQPAVTGQVRTDMLAMGLGLTPEQAALQGPDSEYTLALTELNTLASAPTPEQAEQAYVNLLNLGVPANQARALIDTTTGQIGQAAAAGVQDTLTLADIDVTELGFQDVNQVAGLLGLTPEEAAGLTIDQIAAQAENLRQQELSRVESLRTEIANLPLGDPRRQQMMQQLRDLGYVGVTGTEVEAAQSVEALETADVVTIGGQQVTIAEALNDDNISKLVEQYLMASPEQQNELLPPDVYGDLRQWVDSNRDALTQASEGLRQTAQQVQTVQQQLEDLSTPLPGVIIDKALLQELTGQDLNQAVTQQELNDIQDALGSTGVGQLIENPSEDAANILNKISPENIEFVKNASLEQLTTASQAADITRNDPEVAKIMGLTGQDDFITNPVEAQRIQQYSQVFDNLRSSDNAQWLSNEAFMALPPEDMQVLIDNPERFQDFDVFADLKKGIQQAESSSDILTLMFDMNEQQFADVISELDTRAIVDPEVRALRDELKQVQQGLSSADPKALLDALMADATEQDFVQGTAAASSLMQRLEELANTAKAAKEAPQTAMPETQRSLLSAVMEDKKLTPEELKRLTPAQAEEAYSLMQRLEGVDTSAMPSKYEDFEDRFIKWPNDQLQFNVLTSNVAQAPKDTQATTDKNIKSIIAVTKAYIDTADKSKLSLEGHENLINNASNTALSSINEKITSLNKIRERKFTLNSDFGRNKLDQALDAQIKKLQEQSSKIESIRDANLQKLAKYRTAGGSAQGGARTTQHQIR